MQIEEGKFYKNRNGEKVGPMRVRPNYRGLYKWWDGFCFSYRGDGGFHDRPHDEDLTEEWEEPTALPLATEADEGWGPWNGGTVLYESQTHMFDYREECINGVWRWQSRPRKPVVKKFVKYLAPKPYFKYEIHNTIGTDATHKISFDTIDGVMDCSSIKMEPL